MSELREASMPFVTTIRYYFAKDADARIADLVRMLQQACDELGRITKPSGGRCGMDWASHFEDAREVRAGEGSEP